MTYKPASYAEMVDNAVDAVSAAITDGLRLLEVEFPALPVKLDGKYFLPANKSIWQSSLGAPGASRIDGKGRGWLCGMLLGQAH